MVFFIPWRGGGRGIRRGAFWLRQRDAARPARSAWSVQRQLAARFDGEVAGGAVADSVLVISGSGRRWSSGDSMVRSPAVGAIDDDDDVSFGERRWWRRRVAQLRGHRQRSRNSPAITVGRLASLSPGAARKDQRNLAALLILSALTRAREAWAARCCSTCSIGLVGAAAAGRTIRW